jgi:hypothetical protein
MNRKAKQLSLALVALAVLFLLPAAAKADPIALTLDATHTVAAGGTAIFQGTLFNGGPPGRFVNAVSFTFSGGFANFTFDPSAFFAAVPPFVAQGFGTGVLPVDFFDIIVSASAAPGLYTGSFSVLGGATDSDVNTLATQNFTLLVQGAQTAVPEPASMFLLASGLGGAALARRRAKQKGKTETSC